MPAKDISCTIYAEAWCYGLLISCSLVILEESIVTLIK